MVGGKCTYERISIRNFKPQVSQLVLVRRVSRPDDVGVEREEVVIFEMHKVVAAGRLEDKALLGHTLGRKAGHGVRADAERASVCWLAQSANVWDEWWVSQMWMGATSKLDSVPLLCVYS